MTGASYSAAEILEQLDACAKAFTFPMLDNGYVYLADARLRAYRDPERWAIVIEVVGATPRAGGHDGLHDCLHWFGNCLGRAPGAASEDFLSRTSDAGEAATFDDEYEWYLVDEVRAIRVRDEVVPLDVSADALARKGIVPEEPGRINGAELLRSLVPEHRDLLFATDAELARRLPPDLSEILRLEAWHHPDLANGRLPSESLTFQMIADVLVTGDAAWYRPSDTPNTDWRNWPGAGTL